MYKIFMFIVLVSLGVTDAVVYPSIPTHLLPCYRGGGPKLGAPKQLDVFLSLLKKLESNSRLDLRLFSAALLRSLRLDGVEQAANPVETEFVTPYRASAFQFYKFKLLMDLFVPSQSLLEVDESLSWEEKCMLHKLISSTIQAWERGDENTICPLTIQFRQSMSVDLNSTRARSRCPIENGVIKTEWGTIAPGTVIAAITASLESQRVSVTDILNTDLFRTKEAEPLMVDNGEWDVNIETLDSVKNSPSVTSADISNVWVSTLAGDLAEVVITQGPRVGASSQNMVIGSNNKWNDTVMPRDYYMFIENQTFWNVHFTDAEILAGIDGLILASYVPTWVSQRSTIRLSQIIEMYYSNEGVVFEPSVKACNRQALYAKVFDRTQLLSEMSSFAHILALTQGSVYVSVEERDRISEAAVVAFENYVPTVLKQYHRECTTTHNVPVMDILVATDGAWKGYDVEQFMSWLGTTLELGLEQSSMGLIHGTTGAWIAPPSNNLVDFYAHVTNYTNEWPTRLNLPNVITKVIEYSQQKTIDESDSRLSATPPTVVLVISPNDRLSANEVERSRDLMASLRMTYFDVYFAYVAEHLGGFQNINNEYMDYSELFVQVESSSVQDVIKSISSEVIEIIIPKNVIGVHCPINDTVFTQVEYEDFVLPGRENKYRIHPYYLKEQSLINVNFRNNGMGTLLACSWRGADGSRNCQTLSERQSYTFNLTAPCPSVDFCTPAHFSVSALTTLNLCANDDCRLPQQVGYYIQHSGLNCLALRSSAERIHLMRLLLLAFIYCVLWLL